MNPTRKQILAALRNWKETLVESHWVPGEQKVTDPKILHEVACIEAAAAIIVASGLPRRATARRALKHTTTYKNLTIKT